jgi:hypothetical protein
MRLSLLLIGTAYLSLGLGSAQACSVEFQTGQGIASPARFALLWQEPGQDRVNGRFFMLYQSDASTPVQENIPPNAQYCSGWVTGGPLWSWESNCATRIWPDGKCSDKPKVISFPF